jgi:methylated-DNA-protein-cysteine methyltransferase related protein
VLRARAAINTFEYVLKGRMTMPSQPITHDDMSLLAAQVYALVRACPPGRVTTYGWLGAAVGYPRGARMIGWIMNETPKGASVPAQRVINSKGELSGSWAFGQRGRMRELLEHEGIVFNEAGRVDMKRFGWDPGRDLSVEQRQALLAEAAAAPVPVSDRLMHLVWDDPASPVRISGEPE